MSLPKLRLLALYVTVRASAVPCPVKGTPGKRCPVHDGAGDSEFGQGRRMSMVGLPASHLSTLVGSERSGKTHIPVPSFRPHH